ncbi:protein of unknown function [Enterobacter cancerogenus]|nr:protein of unknown function [Enterobacter cancerogenus]
MALDTPARRDTSLIVDISLPWQAWRTCKFHFRYGSHYSQYGVYPFPFFMETDFPFPLNLM